MDVYTQNKLWLATVGTSHEKPVSIVMKAIDPFLQRLSDVGNGLIILVIINIAMLAIRKALVLLPVMTEQITTQVNGVFLVVHKMLCNATRFVLEEW